MWHFRGRKKSRKSQLDIWLEESSSDDDFVDSDTEAERRRADRLLPDTDHWLIQKLIRYMKVCLLKHILRCFISKCVCIFYYAQKQLLLSARLSHRNSVRPSVRLSVRPSVRHAGGSGKNGPSKDHQIFTVGCPEDFSFRNRKAFS